MSATGQKSVRRYCLALRNKLRTGRYPQSISFRRWLRAHNLAVQRRRTIRRTADRREKQHLCLMFGMLLQGTRCTRRGEQVCTHAVVRRRRAELVAAWQTWRLLGWARAQLSEVAFRVLNVMTYNLLRGSFERWQGRALWMRLIRQRSTRALEGHVLFLLALAFESWVRLRQMLSRRRQMAVDTVAVRRDELLRKAFQSLREVSVWIRTLRQQSSILLDWTAKQAHGSLLHLAFSLLRAVAKGDGLQTQVDGPPPEPGICLGGTVLGGQGSLGVTGRRSERAREKGRAAMEGQDSPPAGAAWGVGPRRSSRARERERAVDELQDASESAVDSGAPPPEEEEEESQYGESRWVSSLGTTAMRLQVAFKRWESSVVPNFDQRSSLHRWLSARVGTAGPVGGPGETSAGSARGGSCEITTATMAFVASHWRDAHLERRMSSRCLRDAFTSLRLFAAASRMERSCLSVLGHVVS